MFFLRFVFARHGSGFKSCIHPLKGRFSSLLLFLNLPHLCYILTSLAISLDLLSFAQNLKTFCRICGIAFWELRRGIVKTCKRHWREAIFLFWGSTGDGKHTIYRTWHVSRYVVWPSVLPCIAKSVALRYRERSVLNLTSFDWNEAKDPYCFVLCWKNKQYIN